MLLEEKLKKLLELKISSNGFVIDDIQIVSDREYGYIIVLVNEKSIYNEILETKLEALEGRKILPDLWIFGPYLCKVGNSLAENPKSNSILYNQNQALS
ncbi:MAG: hypothetical protein QXJ96_02080 [Candidatus Aenigmatarchaeota archaeon]|nr:hypothetical protein [Candidatus Aenigmarchaeota archaeon]